MRADEAAINSAQQAVRADEAAVESAKLQLGYTTIRSPVDGRTGSLMLHEGNVVRASGTNDSTLVVINQVRPIYVSFTAPQQQLPTIKRYMAEGTARGPGSARRRAASRSRASSRSSTMPSTRPPARSGSRRRSPNEEKRLWPGQFVNVDLTLTVDPDAIVIPAAALQSGQQQSQYVFVVKDDSTVDVRRVTVEADPGRRDHHRRGAQGGRVGRRRRHAATRRGRQGRGQAPWPSRRGTPPSAGAPRAPGGSPSKAPGPARPGEGPQSKAPGPTPRARGKERAMRVLVTGAASGIGRATVRASRARRTLARREGAARRRRCRAVASARRAGGRGPDAGRRDRRRSTATWAAPTRPPAP